MVMPGWQSAILGVVEGLTEYLPVSSTGHLLLTQRLLGIPEDEASKAYAICIQAGAIAAVLGLYARHVKSMVLGLVGKDTLGRQLFVHVLAGFLPAAVIGFLFDKKIERFLFGLWPITVAWLVGGIVILAVHRKMAPTCPGRALSAMTVRDAVIIGLAQCIAMWPGTSRSLVTILAGLMVGLEMTAAVEFSFLLGLLTLSAATGYKLLKSGSVMLATYGAPSLAIGFVIAAVSAFLAVRWMVGWLQKRGLSIFGYYRIALAVVVMGLLASGVLHP